MNGMEMRWLVDPRQEWQRKLQYRYIVAWVQEEDFPAPASPRYSEWQDVAEVSGCSEPA